MTTLQVYQPKVLLKAPTTIDASSFPPIDLSQDDCFIKRKKVPNRNKSISFNTSKKIRKTKNPQKPHSTKMPLKKVVCLKTLLTFLNQHCHISESAQMAIEATLLDKEELIQRILKGANYQIYTPELKDFVITLHFYSSKAYNYVRCKLNKSLPHPSTITKWFRSSDCSPGFNQEALCAIRLKADEARKQNKTILCNLLMDTIRLKECYDYVDFGVDLGEELVPEVQKAFVFMLVALNDSWKIPVGYFLVDQLSSREQANLIFKCLRFLKDSRVKVTSLTLFASFNFDTANFLGADFSDLNNLKTFFLNPTNKERVYIFFETAQLLEHFRLCLCCKKSLRTEDGKNVEWKHLEELVKFQSKKDGRFKWPRRETEVKEPFLTFSDSCADALLFVSQDLKLNNFKGAEGISNFCRIFYDLFGIFNSKSSIVEKQLKKPLCLENELEIFNYLDLCVKYIMGLRLRDGACVLKSDQKSGFLGFLVCIKSLKEMFVDLVKRKEPLIECLSTYDLSMDHIKDVLKAIEIEAGLRDLPFCNQFKDAYKRILMQGTLEVENGSGSDSYESLSDEDEVEEPFFLKKNRNPGREWREQIYTFFDGQI